jgi:NAD(P)H-hydrate epimerase
MSAGFVVETIDESLARRLLPRREVGAHKWGVGGLVVVAGAPWYHGAAVLCCMAAGRAGAGIVSLAGPPEIMTALMAHAPETSVIPIDDGDPDLAAAEIATRATRIKALVVGPGLGLRPFTDQLLTRLFGFGGRIEAMLGTSIPAVIDADALTWLSRQPRWYEQVEPGTLVLTPHLGEMARLVHRPTHDLSSLNPAEIAQTAANVWKQTVVLKVGHTTVSDGARTSVAEDAPPSLASAGTGDVLAGTIGAFLAQGLPPYEAAQLAVFVGPKAARRVEKETGVLGLIASDLPLATAKELARLERLEETRDE